MLNFLKKIVNMSPFTNVELKNNRCSSYSSCSTCSSDEECGWCDSTKECIPASREGECYNPEDNIPVNSKTFITKGTCCPSCSQHLTFKDCISSNSDGAGDDNCSWCFSTATCNSPTVERSETAGKGMEFVGTGFCRACSLRSEDGYGPGAIDENYFPVSDYTTSSTRIIAFCSGKGTLQQNSDLKSYHCECDDGYWGDGCEHKCDYSCNGNNDDGLKRGFCDRDTGKCVCACGFAGHDCQTRVENVDCPAQSVGEPCVSSLGNDAKLVTCGVVLETGESNTLRSCSGNLSAGYETGSDHVCECKHGWFGPQCTESCPGVFRDGNIGFKGNACGSGECDSGGVCTCPPCHLGGGNTICSPPPNTCADERGQTFCNIETNNAECWCYGQMYGKNCNECRCKNYGRCNEITGDCICEPGFSGTQCETQVMPPPPPSPPSPVRHVSSFSFSNCQL